MNIKNAATKSTYEREGGKAETQYQGLAVRKAILGPTMLYTFWSPSAVTSFVDCTN